MTNTANTILELNQFRADVNEMMRSREILSFNLGAIEIENEKLTLNGEALSKDATKKVLSHLRVKNNFLDTHKSLSPTDWNLVKEKLKAASGEQVAYARKITKAGSPLVDDIFMKAPKISSGIELDAVFNELIQSVTSTAKDLSIKRTAFLEDKDEVCVTLLEHGNEIDMFANGTDLWKTGKQVVWNGVKFSVTPFFERLVCSNGNTAAQYGFRANISNNKFNMNKIQNVLTREITMESDSMSHYLVEAGNHLKHLNVSVAEFIQYKHLFNEEDHKDILEKYFNENMLNRAYGCIVSEMPQKWQQTADTGINGYDFFNNLTYIASHPTEIKMDTREALDLQVKASNLLFKEKLDLELIAPKIKVNWN